MSCTQANAAGAPAADGDRRRSRLAGGIASLIAKVWRAYWDWRVKRTTVLVLHALDRRTLHDIGIDPSEIESLVYHAGRDRRRRGDASRSWHGGGV
jgi:uncharacterized protein YjiS (DUF1127 family)